MCDDIQYVCWPHSLLSGISGTHVSINGPCYDGQTHWSIPVVVPLAQIAQTTVACLYAQATATVVGDVAKHSYSVSQLTDQNGRARLKMQTAVVNCTGKDQVVAFR